MKQATIDCDGTVYTVREIPASLLRRHADLSSPAAQLDMLGLCILGDDKTPIGDRVDDMVPMRHVEQLVTEIAALSGFSGNSSGDSINTS